LEALPLSIQIDGRGGNRRSSTRKKDESRPVLCLGKRTKPSSALLTALAKVMGKKKSFEDLEGASSEIKNAEQEEIA